MKKNIDSVSLSPAALRWMADRLEMTQLPGTEDGARAFRDLADGISSALMLDTDINTDDGQTGGNVLFAADFDRSPAKDASGADSADKGDEYSRRSGTAGGNEISCGVLRICPRSRQVFKSGEEVSLTPKEFDILYFLASNRGEVFTKEQIYRAVWDEEYLMDDSNIMAFIRKLRRKIEPHPDEPEYILTVWGIGYKFNDRL